MSDNIALTITLQIPDYFNEQIFHTCLYYPLCSWTKYPIVHWSPKKERNKGRKKNIDLGLEERDHVISTWHSHVKNKQDKTTMVSKHQELHSNWGGILNKKLANWHTK